MTRKSNMLQSLKEEYEIMDNKLIKNKNFMKSCIEIIKFIIVPRKLSLIILWRSLKYKQYVYWERTWK
jgi:hypothetical protein